MTILSKHLNYIAVLLMSVSMPLHAEIDKNAPEYLQLRKDLTLAFNGGDSAAFFQTVNRLEDYCLAHDDLHTYYTQRCNEIVFLLNRQSIYEAYKLATGLSRELREQHLESELYMAINMMGHVYRYCGNKDMARQCFREALSRMEAAGYYESMPPVYMNLVNIDIDEHPDEAMRLLERAAQLADSTGRSRDGIDDYRAIVAFKQGDMTTFREGYRRYEEQLAKGVNSVYGTTLEAYHLLSIGDVAGALKKAEQKHGATGVYETKAFIYEYVGDWQQAYKALQRVVQLNDSVASVVLSNGMQGIKNELEIYQAERETIRMRGIMLISIVVCMLVIIVLLLVHSFIRRKHLSQLREARDHALESDRMKTAFISNISHEIRTPLNIISGFMQVMGRAKPSDFTPAERDNITKMMVKNTNLITMLVDELLDLSIYDSTSKPDISDVVKCNELCVEVMAANENQRPERVQMVLRSKVDDNYQLLTNRGMLRKILNALVDNALKYTEEGTVALGVEQRGSTVAFFVEDTGIGIPAADAERVFERFEKLNDFKSGLGLGLSLARKLAQLMGGSLILDTSYTAGARFVLELPLP